MVRRLPDIINFLTAGAELGIAIAAAPGTIQQATKSAAISID